MTFRNTVLAGLSCVLAPLFWAAARTMARPRAAQQDVVDRSTLALQEILNSTQSKDVVDTLRSARAVIICPQVFKAGFVIGGSGGNCVLMARAAGGSWSDPAFYDHRQRQLRGPGRHPGC